MRLLGLDYGSKNIGLALSDEGGRIAFPYKIIYNNKRALPEIKSVVKLKNVSKIILGLPISFAGGENQQTKEVKDFAEKLKKKIKLPVEFENEILTTKSAKAWSTKEMLDTSAAAIILQSHLDKNRIRK